MIKEYITASAALNMQILGLVIFTVVFVVINVWVFRKTGKKLYEDQAQLPFSKESE